MSRTIRRTTGEQPTFSASWGMIHRHGPDFDRQARYDEAVANHRDWVRRFGRDGLNGHSTRNQRYKAATHRARRNEWRVQKDAAAKLDLYDLIGPYDCGCKMCDQEMIDCPFVDFFTQGDLIVNVWEFF